MSKKISPMFPLGCVLFPEAILPLHVFEERYRVMVEEIMDTDRSFGVVLIERGNEVGGGEIRKEIGTLAKIIDSKKFIDGRSLLVTRGVRRVQVDSWLEDSPYPKAEISFLDDAPNTSYDFRQWSEIVSHMRRVFAVLAELGDEVPPISIEISDDPALGSFQMSSLIPITPFDSQKLLEVTSVTERCGLLKKFLANIEADSNSRLLE